MKLLQTSPILILCLAAALLNGQQQQQTPAKPAAPPPSLANPSGVEAKPVPPEAVVLTIGAEKITRAHFERIVAALTENGQNISTPAAKRQLADKLGELLALTQEARKRKLDQSPAVQEMTVLQGYTVLANALQREVGKELKVDDAALHAYYDQHKSEFEVAKASHILIRFKGSRVPLKANEKDLTEEEALAKAQDIRKQLLAGGDFAAIAKTESDDTGSGAAGGSLGPAGPRGRFVPAFDQAVFTQPVGQIGEPVKTPFGYHLIRVDERTAKTFDEARPDIEKKLRPEKTREEMEKIHKAAQVTLDDAYFGK